MQISSIRRSARLLALSLLLLLAAAGCRTAQTVDGKPCYPVSEDGQRELVQAARASLAAPNKIITPDEYRRFIKDQEPTITIAYTGNSCGKARLLWSLPLRDVAVIFNGELPSPEMYWHVEVVSTDDRIIFNDEKKQKADREHKSVLEQPAPTRPKNRNIRKVVKP